MQRQRQLATRATDFREHMKKAASHRLIRRRFVEAVNCEPLIVFVVSHIDKKQSVFGEIVVKNVPFAAFVGTVFACRFVLVDF
jgi:hypothetical protein